MLSYTEENYLKTIYKISGRLTNPVSTNAIAYALKTTAASVTDMFRKLADKKLVTYEKYKGVTLTKSGEEQAVNLIRKHRLWEVFLVEKLGFTWDEVHEVAEQLEHIRSPKMINKLDSFLNYPRLDPHGDPIPDEAGNIEYDPKRSLADLKEGQSGVIVGVRDSSSKFLQYLNSINISLGSKVQIVKHFEFDDSQVLSLNDREKITISSLASRNLLIELV